MYFFLNDIKCEYLMRRSIITRIESYFMQVIEFFNFDNLMIKFMIISSQMQSMNFDIVSFRISHELHAYFFDNYNIS